MALTDANKAVDNIQDITITGIQRTKFRINGSNDAIIELNLSDMSAIERLEDSYKKLQQSMEELSNLNSEDENLTANMKRINTEMCETIDYIFDYPVSAVCCKHGTMYDLTDGMFRYEHIIDSLSKLYTNNLNEEFKKLRKRVQKYTDKYVPAKTTTKRSKKS